MVNVRPEWRQNIHSPFVLVGQTVTVTLSFVLNKQPNLTCVSYIFVSLKKYDHVHKNKITQGSVNFFNQNYPENKGFSLAWLLMFTQSFVWLVC